MSLDAQLKKAKSLWNKAKEMKPDFDNVVPDGVYVGKITKAEVGESQSSGRLQVGFAAQISGGEYKGEKVYWYSGLKTEQNFMYLQRDIVRLGKQVPADINDLTDILEEIQKEKPSIRFKVKTDGEFQNVRILKALNADEAPEEDETTDAEPEDEEAPEDVQPEEEDEKEEKEEAEVEVEEEEVEEDEAPTLDVGTRVAFDFKGEEFVGEVTELVDDGEVARIKADDGKKYKIKIEKLRPAPKAKVKKKK